MNYAWMSLKRFDKKGDSANKRKDPQLLEKKKNICRQERKAKDELKGNGQVKFLNGYKETMMQVRRKKGRKRWPEKKEQTHHTARKKE